MLDLALNFGRRKRPRILFVGAHCDDIEIGCGGTIIELLRRHRKAEVCWVVLSSNPERAKEARRAASALLRGVEKKSVLIADFRESFFPSEFGVIKEFFEEKCKPFAPDVVFTHYKDDLHQDHRIVGELVWNTFRDQLILEYEIPKFDGGMGSPSVFVPLSRATVQRKVKTLTRCFATQAKRPWFTPDTFTGLMRLRGVECNAPDGFAEAFYSRKIVLSG